MRRTVLSVQSLFALSLAGAPLVLGCSRDGQKAEAPPTSAVVDASVTTPSSDAATASTSDGAPAGSVAAVPTAPKAALMPDAGSPDEPPRVKIVTIGMHVGGGPYDEVTKEPIKRSVEPHFPELARCWKHVTQPASADVGVDLVIEAGGGRAKVSNPRASIAGEGFVPCIVTFYEGIDFQKPLNGRTVVSYSVRFKP